MSPAPGACWRVQFATWAPPLDWNKAGHAGETRTVDRALRRIRDSVFDRDTVASQSNAMIWEYSSRGWSLMLYPSWWPAGVSITFDTALKSNTDLSGDAVALVADGSRQGSRARAHVWQVTCG